MARRYSVDYNPNVLQGLLPEYKARMARVESGDDYNALGKEIPRKGGKVDRAYGKYQVMGANIPEWTEQALGRPLTPFEFLHSPEAQEKVFENQTLNSYHKYGNLQDAASVWFSGRPLAEAQAAGAHDINMPVGQYVSKVFGGEAPQEMGPQYAQAAQKSFGERYVPSWEQQTQTDETAPKSFGQRYVPSWEAEPPSNLDITSPEHLAETRLHTQPQGEIPVLKPPPEQGPWGFGLEYGNAVTAGLVPYVSGAVGGPSNAQIQEWRRGYELRNPVASVGANLLGGLTQAAVGGGAVAALPKIAAYAPALRPALPVIEKATEFLEHPGMAKNIRGEFERLPGLGQAAVRMGARPAVGAAGGATQAFVNQNLAPDIPAWEQMALGGTIGAAANPLLRGAGSFFENTVNPAISASSRAAATQAQKLGIPILPWQVAETRGAQKIGERLVNENLAKEQVSRLNDALGQTFDHGTYDPKFGRFIAKAMNTTEIGKTIDKIAQKLENLSTTISIDPARHPVATNNLMANIVTLGQEIAQHVDPAEQNKLNRTLYLLYNEMTNPTVSGKTIQNLTQKNGTIDKNLNPSTNSILKYYNTRMKSIVNDFLADADPTLSKEWQNARQEYKNALIAFDAASKSGTADKINPAVLKAAASRVKAKGLMGDLATISEKIPAIDKNGVPILPALSPEKSTFAKGAGLVGVGSLGSALLEKFGPEKIVSLFTGNLPPPETLMFLSGLGMGGAAVAKVYPALRDYFLKQGMVSRLVTQGSGKSFQTGTRKGLTSFGLTYGREDKRRQNLLENYEEPPL